MTGCCGLGRGCSSSGFLSGAFSLVGTDSWQCHDGNCGAVTGDEVDLEPVIWMLKFWLTVVSCSRVRVYGVLGEAGVCEPG